jgi:hypothetical protein
MWEARSSGRLSFQPPNTRTSWLSGLSTVRVTVFSQAALPICYFLEKEKK